MVMAEFDDPQCDPSPPLSFQTSCFRLLQTVNRPVLQIFQVLLQYLFPPLHRTNAVEICIRPSAIATRGRWGVGETHDLECIEIWEGFARNNQLRYCGAYPSGQVRERNSRVRFFKAGMWVRADNGEFDKP